MFWEPNIVMIQESLSVYKNGRKLNQIKEKVRVRALPVTLETPSMSVNISLY